jgi:hypothetical protein
VVAGATVPPFGVIGADGCVGAGAAGFVLFTAGTVAGAPVVAAPVVGAVLAVGTSGLAVEAAGSGVDSTTGVLLVAVSAEMVLGAFSWQETKLCTARAAKIKLLNAFFIIIRLKLFFNMKNENELL